MSYYIKLSCTVIQICRKCTNNVQKCAQCSKITTQQLWWHAAWRQVNVHRAFQCRLPALTVCPLCACGSFRQRYYLILFWHETQVTHVGRMSLRGAAGEGEGLTMYSCLKANRRTDALIMLLLTSLAFQVVFLSMMDVFLHHTRLSVAWTETVTDRDREGEEVQQRVQLPIETRDSAFMLLTVFQLIYNWSLFNPADIPVRRVRWFRRKTVLF